MDQQPVTNDSDDFRAIFDMTLDALLAVDRNGMIERANRAAETLFDASSDEIVDSHISRVVPDLLGDEHWQPDLSGGRHRLHGRRSDGELFPVEVTVGVADAGGRRFYVLGVHDVTTLTKTAQQLEELELIAHVDPLTGLPNRRSFSHSLQQSVMAGRAGAVLFVDLDGFKNVNDRCGHLTGDRVLRAAAERIAGCLRAPDSAGRFGGDEFTLLVHEDDTGVASIERVARRVSRLFSHPVTVGGDRFRFTVSIGIAYFPSDGTDPEELVRRADAAMYVAKRRGGATTAAYEAEHEAI